MMMKAFIRLAILCVLAHQGSAVDEFFVCEENGTFADPENCEHYYVCDGKQQFPMECPPGLFFDETTGICNLPELVDCKVGEEPTTTTEPPSPSTTSSTVRPTTTSTTSRPTSTTTTSRPTTTTTTTTTSSTAAPTTVKPGPGCPEEGTALLPDPVDCTKFYVCIEGQYDILDCPYGYGFSVENQTCVKAEEVGCEIGNSSTTTPPPYQPNCPTSGVAKLPNPEDCGSYFYCINGHPALLTCPDGMNFDNDTGTCTFGALCDSDPTNSTPTSPTTSLPSTTTTSKPTVTPTTTTSTTPKPTVTPTTSTTAKPPVTSSTTTSKPTTSAPTTCSSSEEGDLRPNPESCTSFLQCAAGHLVEIECPAGLEFNPDFLLCDRPENANCSVKTV